MRRITDRRADTMAQLARAAAHLTGGATVVVLCRGGLDELEVAAHATAYDGRQHDLGQVLASIDPATLDVDAFLDAAPDLPLESLPDAWRMWAGQHQPLRSLVVPLAHGDRVLGWLWVGAMIGPDRIDQLRDLAAVAALRHAQPDPVVVQADGRRAAMDVEATLSAGVAAVEQANQAVDRLADVVGHDVRDAIRDLLGWSRLGDAEGVDEGLRSELLVRIRRTAERVGGMIGDVLEEVAAIQAGRRDQVAVDLNGIMGWVRDSVEDLLAEHDAELVVETLPTMASASPTLLRAALLELVRNAVEHGGHGVRVRVDVRESNGSVGLVVEDDGPGLPDDQLEQLFAGGVTEGLGLTRVRDCVARMGGRITAERGPAGGTAVHVVLPRHADQVVR